MTPPSFLELSKRIGSAASQVHWFVLGFGAIVSAVSGIAILAQPSAPVLHEGWRIDRDHGYFLGIRPGASEHIIERSEPARVLSGISGEMSKDGESRIAAFETSTRRLDENIAPVVWNELSDTANCLTVTTKTGENFSFRVLGIEPKKTAQSHTKGAANLAIAPCSNNGAFVEKAIIEPDAAIAAREPGAARSL